MKKQALLTVFLGMVVIANAQSVVDGGLSNYKATSVSSIDWATSNPPKVVYPSLSYDGLLTDAMSNAVAFGGSGSIGSNKIAFAQQSSGVVYASFIIRVVGLQSWATNQYKYNFCFTNSANTFAGAVNIFPDASSPTNKFILGVSKRNSNSYSNANAPFSTANQAIVWGTTSYPLNTNILLVIGYDLSTPGDIVRLWVNPPKSSLGATVAPAATLVDASSASTITATHNLAYFNMRTGSGSPSVITDELRIGTSWASVTPPVVSAAIVPSSNNTGQDYVFFQGNMLFVVGQAQDCAVELYSSDGKLLGSYWLTNGAANVGILQSGIYIVKVLSPKGTVTYKAAKF